jgi:hypothetical protein
MEGPKMSDEKPVTRIPVLTLRNYNDDHEAGVFEVLEGYEPGDSVAVMLWSEYAELRQSREQTAAVERERDGIEEKLTQRSRDLDDANARLRAAKARAESAERERDEVRGELRTRESLRAEYLARAESAEREISKLREFAEHVVKILPGSNLAARARAAVSPAATTGEVDDGDTCTCSTYPGMHPSHESAPVEAPGKGCLVCAGQHAGTFTKTNDGLAKCDACGRLFPIDELSGKPAPTLPMEKP